MQERNNSRTKVPAVWTAVRSIGPNPLAALIAQNNNAKRRNRKKDRFEY